MRKIKESQILNTAADAQAQNKMQSCLTIPGEYAYEWNLRTDAITGLGTLCKKLGYKKDSFPATLKDWEENMIHPADCKRVKNARYLHLKTGGPFYTRYRVKQKNGSYVFLTARGKATVNSQGTPYAWKGLVQLLPL